LEIAMHIHGPTHVHGPHAINPPHFANRGTAAHPTGAGGVDRVEISPAAEAAIQAAETSAIRHDEVNRIRAEIAAGTYETPAKLDLALERMLDQIA
jgi:negative regulator of flagellin synthesis FlgM